jgi:general secretion pathway protein G
MRTQEKANASFRKSRIFRAMAMTAPNQRGAVLDNRGFTLVELIIVMAIIGILATMAVPAYHDLSLKAKNASAKADIRTLDQAINAYFIDQNKNPGQLSDIGTQANIKDPWNRSYMYFNIGTGTGSDVGPQYTDYTAHTLNDDYDLYSQGPDGSTAHSIPAQADPAVSASRDDIVRAGSGSTVEFASEF